jgi:hypothetical protein
MGSGEVEPADNILGVVSLFAEDEHSQKFKEMLEIINSVRTATKDAK